MNNVFPSTFLKLKQLSVEKICHGVDCQVYNGDLFFVHDNDFKIVNLSDPQLNKPTYNSQ